MPLKIAMLLSNALDPDPRVENEAIALANAGYSVKVIAWNRSRAAKQIEKKQGFVVERIGPKTRHGLGVISIFYFMLFYLNSFIKLLKTDFDVVHCHDFDTLLPGFFAAKVKQKKIVYDSHEFYSWMLQDNGMRVVPWLVSMLETVLARRVDCVITVAPAFAGKFREMGARKVLLVLNSKPLADYNISQEEVDAARRKLGLGGKKVFLYIGNLCEQRMLLELVEVFNSGQCGALVLGGTGKLAEKIRENAVPEKIVLLNAVPADQVPLYSKMAHALLAVYDPEKLNNKNSVPNKFFEAIAAGRPAIFAKRSFAERESARLGFGVGVEYGSGEEALQVIRAISREAGLYKRLCSAATNAQSAFNWEREAAKLVALYKAFG